jgi:hypothetical protein
LLLVGTLVVRLGLEALVNQTVGLAGRVGGSRPGRKVLTLVHAMVAGGSHIDHAEVLRAGNTAGVLPYRVMAPSTLGTFLRSFTFGHVRQLEAVVGKVLERAWALGAGPGVFQPLRLKQLELLALVLPEYRRAQDAGQIFQGFFGVKGGIRRNHLGIFGKVRPGFQNYTHTFAGSRSAPGSARVCRSGWAPPPRRTDTRPW